jgi:hypothetical protein
MMSTTFRVVRKGWNAIQPDLMRHENMLPISVGSAKESMGMMNGLREEIWTAPDVVHIKVPLGRSERKSVSEPDELSSSNLDLVL